MRIDGSIPSDLSKIAAAAKKQEAAGYDGVWAAETSRDPFLPLTLAAEHTTTLELGTSIAVAFARSPMTLAQTANDLQQFSQGRFNLGLGSQIQTHIEKRFSMPWSAPAARMREFVLAMRAIWNTWNTGERLAFRGEFYTHTVMTPFFNPGVNPYGAPKVFLAGVGTLMTEVAGEVCDGFIAHGFTTESYLREVSLPALQRGIDKSAIKVGAGPSDSLRSPLDHARPGDAFQVSLPSFIVTGENDEQMAAAAEGVRQQIAFYASTPAYRTVLDHHGWGDMQPELTALSKRSEWVAMGELITDDIIDAFAVRAPVDQVAEKLQDRFAGAVDRLSLYAPYSLSAEHEQAITSALRSAQ
jgi:probable F420-dependent oxidoreductase